MTEEEYEEDLDEEEFDEPEDEEKPKPKKKVTEEPKQKEIERYVAVHQTELKGIMDRNKPNEVQGEIFQILAEILNRLERIEQSV